MQFMEMMPNAISGSPNWKTSMKCGLILWGILMRLFIQLSRENLFFLPLMEWHHAPRWTNKGQEDSKVRKILVNYVINFWHKVKKSQNYLIVTKFLLVLNSCISSVNNLSGLLNLRSTLILFTQTARELSFPTRACQEKVNTRWWITFVI